MIKQVFVSYVVILACFSICFYSIATYFTSYYVRFPVAYASQWRSADRDLSYKISELEYKYEKIIIDKSAGFIYTSYLFYASYSPNHFQEEAKWEEADSEGFSFPQSFGKFEFTSEEMVGHYPSERVLYITNTNEVFDNLRLVDTIYYPKRPVVVALGQEIVQFPVIDPAYYLYEKLP